MLSSATTGCNLENHEQRRAKTWAILAAIAAVVLAVGIWLFMRRRHHQQQRINAELSERIKELSERYDTLNEHYDNAISTNKQEEPEELTAADRDFLEKTINTVNLLILSGQIDANHVAERMGMSLFQFRQRLTAITDETPQAFIQTVRMRRARHLLDKHPEMNVSEIAALCAYNDTPNFTRAFKRTFGLTPTQYLEKQEKAAD
ncbi:MAG: helix-turn-helix transcriptional regulator [Prevotella sp.]|nr:helix-turn-helix transcriptional regulator [Prevotella sp.]